MKRTKYYPSAEKKHVISSGMKRCEETLELLYGEIPHDTNRNFGEMDFGEFEMRSYEQMKNDPAYIAWISGDNDANITPGGESGVIMTSRVIRALESLLNDGKDTLLVTHGGVIAAIMAHIYPEENKNRYQWQPSAGGGYEIDLDNKTYKAI